MVSSPLTSHAMLLRIGPVQSCSLSLQQAVTWLAYVICPPRAGSIRHEPQIGTEYFYYHYYYCYWRPIGLQTAFDCPPSALQRPSRGIRTSKIISFPKENDDFHKIDFFALGGDLATILAVLGCLLALLGALSNWCISCPWDWDDIRHSALVFPTTVSRCGASTFV